MVLFIFFPKPRFRLWGRTWKERVKELNCCNQSSLLIRLLAQTAFTRENILGPMLVLATKTIIPPIVTSTCLWMHQKISLRAVHIPFLWTVRLIWYIYTYIYPFLPREDAWSIYVERGSRYESSYTFLRKYTSKLKWRSIGTRKLFLLFCLNVFLWVSALTTLCLYHDQEVLYICVYQTVCIW